MTDEPLSPSGAPWRNFYGRRHGKKLRPRQQELMENALAALAPPNVTWDDNPDRTPLELPELFGDTRPVWLEIGFGAGEHMCAQAAQNPNVGIIGCEPYINGVAALLSKIDRENLQNVRVHAGDARDLLDVLPAQSLDRAFLLYPDPWPKTRHHRRRFANPENLEPLASAMRPGAKLFVATDIEDYVRHTLEVIDKLPAFRWLAQRPSDWREPWEGWHRTRYEAKAVREGRTPHYLAFERV
ncbi:MAG: tRNA (guanosine(46)-N7)-methyltransferase TrmB [Pseudomonadota bacterium]